MTKTYKTKAIIIGKKNFGEADKLITCYSNSFGKLKLVGRGMQRQTSKLGPHTEQFNLVDLEIVKGRNLDIVIGAESLNHFLEFKKNIDFLAYGYYFAELVDKLCEEGPHLYHHGHHEEREEERTYNLLFECLSELETGPPILNYLAAYFELKLLKVLGYGPEMNFCIVCRGELVPNQNLFSGQMGGLLCPACEGRDAIASDISRDAIKIIRFLLTKDLNMVKKLLIEPKDINEVKKISDYFIGFIIDRNLASRRFLGAFEEARCLVG